MMSAENIMEVQTPDGENRENDVTGNATGNRMSHRRNNRRTYGSSEVKNFSGETSKLEAVLALLTEKVDKEVPFEKFQDKLKNYALKIWFMGKM